MYIIVVNNPEEPSNGDAFLNPDLSGMVAYGPIADPDEAEDIMNASHWHIECHWIAVMDLEPLENFQALLADSE